MTSEWNSTTADLDYFKRQLAQPYQSTIAFFDFLDRYGRLHHDSLIVDACCGSAANSFYAISRYPGLRSVAFDYQQEFLDIAKNHLDELASDNTTIAESIQFIRSDIYSLDATLAKSQLLPSPPDGIIFLQTLSWLSDWREALIQLASLDSPWIAMSSLFYPGLLEAQVSINKYTDSHFLMSSFPYNILSAQLVKSCLRSLGYTNFYFEPFQISQPLPQPQDVNSMGTYTIEAAHKGLLQFSGPLHMPWYFLLATK